MKVSEKSGYPLFRLVNDRFVQIDTGRVVAKIRRESSDLSSHNSELSNAKKNGIVKIHKIKGSQTPNIVAIGGITPLS